MLKHRWSVNVLIAAMSVGLFGVVSLRSGRLPDNDRLGWDGVQYAHMTTDGLGYGTVKTQTRPLVPLLARIPHRAGLDVIQAYQLMNVLFTFALAWSLCLILDVYGVSAAMKTFFVANAALCIATARMFAFYPVQIDLGALAISTLAIAVSLSGGLLLSGLLALLAVTAREFGIAVALYGLHRSIRRGTSVRMAVLTYAPAICALFVIRYWAAAANVADEGAQLISAGSLLDNLYAWTDPVYVAFFVYFLVTLLGGLTAMLASRPIWSLRRLIEEPELMSFGVIIVGAAAAGSADIWRYLVFLLPVIAVLFGKYVQEGQPRALMLLTALVVTVVTQEPLTRMDTTRYFRDWFPLYPWMGLIDDVPDFWAAWTTRFGLASAGVIALWFLHRSVGKHQVAVKPASAH